MKSRAKANKVEPGTAVCQAHVRRDNDRAGLQVGAGSGAAHCSLAGRGNPGTYSPPLRGTTWCVPLLVPADGEPRVAYFIRTGGMLVPIYGAAK